jgi:hypothetical protein
MEEFEIETTIRKIVKELVDPMFRRVLEEKELTLTMRDKFESLTHKVNELDYIAHKSVKKSEMIEEFARRLRDLDNKNSVVDTKITSYSKTFDMHVDFLKNDIQKFHDTIFVQQR